MAFSRSIPFLLAAISWVECHIWKCDVSANEPVVTPSQLHFRRDDEVYTLSVKELLPGRRQEFRLEMCNSTGRDLVLKKVSSSCGCLVLGEIKEAFPKDLSVSVPIKLQPDFTGRKTGREISFEDLEGKEWKIFLQCEFVSPFKVINNGTIKLDGNEKSALSFELELNRDLTDFQQELKDAKVEAMGPTIVSPKIELDGKRFFLKFSTREPEGARFEYSELVRVNCKSFAVDLPFVFQRAQAYRVIPDAISRSRIRDGVFRLVVVGSGEFEKENVRVEACDHAGVAVKLKCEVSGSQRAIVVLVKLDGIDTEKINGFRLFSELESGKEFGFVSIVD